MSCLEKTRGFGECPRISNKWPPFEQFTSTHAVYLGLCQELCTLLGNHLKCAEGPCRRNGACAGIRDQDRFGIPLVLFPPCVPLDREIIETYRAEIVAELKRIMARGK